MSKRKPCLNGSPFVSYANPLQPTVWGPKSMIQTLLFISHNVQKQHCKKGGGDIVPENSVKKKRKDRNTTMPLMHFILLKQVQIY